MWMPAALRAPPKLEHRTSRRPSEPARRSLSYVAQSVPSVPMDGPGSGQHRPTLYVLPWRRRQRTVAHRMGNGTRTRPAPCAKLCSHGTRGCMRGAAPNPRADWLGGRRRAGPFFLPSVFAFRIHSRLRLAASRARGAQRSLQGRAGAAGAARWRLTPCTPECGRNTVSAAVRRHVWRSDGYSIDARTVQARRTRECMVGASSDAGVVQQPRAVGYANEHKLMACSMSTTAARCRSRRTHG